MSTRAIMYTYVCIVWCRGTRRTRCERKLQMAQCICTWFRCHVSNVALRVTPNLAHVLGVVFCALSCEPFISCDMFVDPLSNSIWTSYKVFTCDKTYVMIDGRSATYMEYMYFCMLFHLSHSYRATCKQNPCQTRYEQVMNYISMYTHM